MAVKWRPVSEYADIDGIESRFMNREAREQFFKDFERQTYTSGIDVYDYGKLFDGDQSFSERPDGTFGFQAVPDYSFDRFNMHVRFFDGPGGIIMTAQDEGAANADDILQWAEERGLRAEECAAGRAFHGDRERARMFLITGKKAYRRYRKTMREYRAEK